MWKNKSGWWLFGPSIYIFFVGSQTAIFVPRGKRSNWIFINVFFFFFLLIYRKRKFCAEPMRERLTFHLELRTRSGNFRFFFLFFFSPFFFVFSNQGKISSCNIPDLSNNTLIKAIKPVFATHGAPATLIADNGTNFISSEFRRFLKSWDVNHITSSPHHHQSNGWAEVKLMKGIIKKLQKKELTCGKPSWNGAMQPHQACAVHLRNDSYQGATAQCYHAKPRTARPKYKWTYSRHS